jgi:hypothetical protein
MIIYKQGIEDMAYHRLGSLFVEQMFQNLSAQIVSPSTKVWDFDKKRLHWASVVRGYCYARSLIVKCHESIYDIPAFMFLQHD